MQYWADHLNVLLFRLKSFKVVSKKFTKSYGE